MMISNMLKQNDAENKEKLATIKKQVKTLLEQEKQEEADENADSLLDQLNID